MNNQKHTPEPWKAVRNDAFWEVVTPWPGQTPDEADTDSPSVAYAWGKTEEEAEANARRIVACVNACDGIPTDVLEDKSVLKADNDLRIKREQLEKQRDELLAALKRAETAMEICSDWMTEIEMPDGWTTTTDEKLKISAAIASVKGGAA